MFCAKKKPPQYPRTVINQLFAEELLLSGIISDAMELAASETAEAAELTASDTVLPEEG